MWKRYLIVLVTFVVASGGAFIYWNAWHAQTSLADNPQVRMTVTNFGDQLKMLPLTAPHDLLVQGMNLYYSAYVSPTLLAAWGADPTNAPGRHTSSPWPDRIDIKNIKKNTDGTYTVQGAIVEVANAEGTTTPAIIDTIPVRLGLTQGPDGWQITDYVQL